MMPSTSKSNGQNPKNLLVPELKPQCELKEQKRNWLELPYDVTANILHRIGAIDVLENGQKVCTSWHKICKDPAMWRVIYMENTCSDLLDARVRHRLQEMCKHAVDRSQGQLVDITMVDFANDELLEYVADRSSRLRRLEIACSRSGTSGIYDTWTKSLEKLPLLEELNLYTTHFSEESVAIAGRCCPMLRTLKINREADRHWYGYDPQGFLTILNEIPIAVGENLHELRHLEIIGMNISNIELQVILDGCSHLESLDLRECLYVNLDGEFGKRCSEQIKCLKLPNDSVEGCPYMYKNGVTYTEPRDYDDDDSDYDYSEDITCLHEFQVHDDESTLHYALGAYDVVDDDDEPAVHYALGAYDVDAAADDESAVHYALGVYDYDDDDDLNNIEDLEHLLL